MHIFGGIFYPFGLTKTRDPHMGGKKSGTDLGAGRWRPYVGSCLRPLQTNQIAAADVDIMVPKYPVSKLQYNRHILLKQLC